MTPYYEQDGITIYHGDCRDVLPQLGSFDLVVADPPYSFGMASTFQESKAGSWADLMNAATWYASWLNECRRITANRAGAAWVFNSWRSFPILARAAHESGWPIESLLVWDKQWIGPGGLRGLRPSYELVALFAHPEFSLEDRGLPDIWASKWSALKPHGHPAEKPQALVARLIRESNAHNVLDPFCGSGTTLAAAKGLGYTAVGIEAEERYCEIAARRLSQGVLFGEEAVA
jgi:site-specific DNA-methyltransferase (adenine-specific)